MSTGGDDDEMDENDFEYLSEKEFFDYVDADIALEVEKLNRVVEKYRLRDYLNKDEMQVLRDLWCATNDAEFTIDAGSFVSGKGPMEKIQESATNRAEKHFLAAREKMLECPGWMLLDPEIQEAVCKELFTIRFGAGE